MASTTVAAGSAAAAAASASVSAGAERASSLTELPVVDLDAYLAASTPADRKRAECAKVAECLHKYGVLVVRDSRTSEKDNNDFIDLMEAYFEQDKQTKLKDSRPEIGFQVGSTPEGTEKARNHCSRFPKGLNRPVSLCPPERDVKWRFFYRIGEQPKDSEFAALNQGNRAPEAFRERWGRDMDKWGNKLLQAARDVVCAAAEGFGLPKDEFNKRMELGPHLLAPTGTDLLKYGKRDVAMASYHYDLNFLTVHGKSRFPGLFVWLRDGTRTAVKVPDGCLIMQAGKQFEWMTNGHVMAGFHEVVVTDKTLATVEAKKARKESCWRVSSTLFSHLRSDGDLEPLRAPGDLFGEPNAQKYPKMKVGAYVAEELKAINLSNSKTAEEEQEEQKGSKVEA